jgi:protoheme IX farnesyltransferase
MTARSVSIPAIPFAAYLELAKPRIVTLVLVTAMIGFVLGGRGEGSVLLLLVTLAGTAMVAGGAGALNHYLERECDLKMDRTRRRPIPSGVVAAPDALLYGIFLVLAGCLLLLWKVNLLTAFLGLLTAFLYVLVYTPMKRVSWLNTIVGAIPGAIPPLGGWAAATGTLEPGAWVLFAILFLWQHPHFYAIAWMFKEDYAKGGFKMLPVVDPDGRSTFRQIVLFSLVLIPVSLLPTLLGLSGRLYFAGALVLGVWMLSRGMALASSGSIADARRVLRASVIYLPILLALILVDYRLY